MTSPQERDRDVFGRFGRLLASASVLSFFLITLGSLVRAANAGLACPDWPLCHGEVVPPFDFQIFLEWFHRVVAGFLTIMMVTATVRLARTPRLRQAFGLQVTAAGILLLVQIVLGGLTVLKLLNAKTVAAHLINALLFFTVLVWMTLRARRLARDPDKVRTYPVSPSVKALFAVTTVVVFVQVALGGMVSSNYAGLACPDFPTCNGAWIPPPIFQLWLQMLHRAAAFVVLAVTIWLGLHSSGLPLPPTARLAARLSPWLVLAQIVLGVVNVFYHLPIAASVAHLANAVVIYTLLFMATEAVYSDGQSLVQTPGKPAAAKAPLRAVKDQPI